jgi:hypothetical protein
VDWTAARLGPPAFDVAFTALLLAHPPIQVGPALQRPLQLAGRWLARRFVAATANNPAPADGTSHATNSTGTRDCTRRASSSTPPRSTTTPNTTRTRCSPDPRRHLSKLDRERTHVSPGAQRIVSEVSLGRVERVVAHDEPDVLERNESGVERAGPAMSR